MRNNIFKTVLFFSLFLAMFSFGVRAEPVLLSNVSSTPTNYNTTFTLEFNSTWSSDTIANENITECNFTLGKPDGTFNYYSFSPISTTSPYLCYKSFTQDDLGPAGNYNWTWGVKNDTGWTSTNLLYSFTIDKAATSLNLSLNGTQGNMSFLSNNTATFIVVLNVSGKLVNLTSNYTGLNQSGSSPFSFPSGFYSVGNWWYLTGLFEGDYNYTGSNQTYYFNVNDTTPPAYSSNSTDTPFIGATVQHRLYWIDNAGLSGYNFSFDNCTGNFVNDSWVPMTGLTNWSIIPKTINSTAGCTIRWFISANDTSNNWNYTNIFSYYPGMTNGATCNSDNQCLSIHCVNGACRSTALNTCGDGYCDSGESCTLDNSVCTSGYSCTNGCVAATTTTTTTTTTTSTGTLSIKNLTSTLSINSGESKPVTFTLSNGFSNNLLNVSISVSGIDSGWYTLSKKTISNFIHGSLENITLSFNIPSSADAKNYTVSITAKGTILGSTTVRTAIGNMTLNVNKTSQNVVAPSLTSNTNTNVANVTNETQNITGGEGLAAATGLAPAFEYLKNNMLIIIAIAACVLIFIFREDVNENLSKMTGVKEYKGHSKRPSFDLLFLKEKLNFKLPNLKPSRPAGIEPEKPEIRRPEVLEREIKRDIKELQNIIDTDKKMNKKKKLDTENN